MNRNAKAFFNDNAERWDEISVHDGSKIEYIMSLLELRGSESVLDVGTGTGIMIPFYERYLKNGTVTAIDYSVNMIDIARRKYPKTDHPNISFELTDLYEMRYNNTFDAVICYSCFPHFPDKPKALEILFSALKPQGILMISHSSSRDRINKVHMNGGEAISKDDLPPMQEMRRMFSDAGAHVTKTHDDEDFFIIVGKKKWSQCR